MKKTMIAMAVAGVIAAPMASAEVSISGKIEQYVTATDAPSVDTSDEAIMGTDAWINFSASEDLGNGMTAFAAAKLDLDVLEDDGTWDGTANNSTGQQVQDSKVGISGEFGTVVLGRMEDFSESKVLSMVDVLAGTSVELGDQNAQRNSGGVAYVSPTINGITIGVAGYMLDDATAGGNIDDIDASDVAIMYSNGPLAVNYAVEQSFENTAGQNDDEKISSLGVSYAFGDLSVAGVWQSIDNANTVGTDDHEDTMLTAVYNMGNNSVAVGWHEDELTTGATDNNVTAIEFRHKFSSRTRSYVGMTADDYAAVSSETDTVYAGLEHTF